MRQVGAGANVELVLDIVPGAAILREMHVRRNDPCGAKRQIEASSGTITRHRLNRWGDRQLNRALHTIVLVRMRQDLATKAYLQRRLAEGRTVRDIKRCLKRSIARQLFRQLELVPRPLDGTLKPPTLKRRAGFVLLFRNQV